MVRMDPPVLTTEGFDIADEAAPGCLAGGGDPPPPAVEADQPDADVVKVVTSGWHLRSGDPAPLDV